MPENCSTSSKVSTAPSIGERCTASGPSRLRDQKLCWRIIALYSSGATYSRPLKSFLNRFAGEHRELKALNKSLVTSRFTQAIDLLAKGPGPAAFRHGSGQVNAALAEATSVGLMRRLDSGTSPTPSTVRAAVERLGADKDFPQAISRATADEEQVRKRLEAATASFAGA